MASTQSPKYKAFLRRLHAARLAAGLTQEQVARALGRPQSFVSKCETGERRLDVLELESLARVYGRGLGFFVAEGPGTGGASMTSEPRTGFGRPPARKTARRTGRR
jgi:transcriptional regulator with XRE-family HTH domain